MPASGVLPRQAYLDRLGHAAPAALRTLQRDTGLDRGAAAEAYAAIAALSLAGLARRQRETKDRDERAAVTVVRDWGRPADLRAPEMGIAARLQGCTTPGLGRLLGDAVGRTAGWIGDRTGARAGEVRRVFHALAPLPLGALCDLEPGALRQWMTDVKDDVLDDPGALLGHGDDCAETFRSLRRYGLPWWERMLGVGG